MSQAIEERNRILNMVETGQVSASEAAQLLDTLAVRQEQAEPQARSRNSTLRIWVSDAAGRRSTVKMTATLPVPLVSLGLRMLSRFAPQLNENTLQHITYAIERGATGRVLDVQDLEEGKRLEIFVEQ
jgi:SHOCT-like domain